jgi:hypothetical protein
MTHEVNNEAVLEAGMYWLREKLGVLETETFIAVVRDNHFDYTEWRRDNLWQDMNLDEVFELATKREKERKVG